MSIDIFESAKKGKLDDIKDFILSGGDVNMRFNTGPAGTLAARAYASSKTKLTKHIIMHLKDSQQDLACGTVGEVLKLASACGDLGMLAFLHEVGVDLRMQKDIAMTAAVSADQSMSIAYLKRVCPIPADRERKVEPTPKTAARNR